MSNGTSWVLQGVNSDTVYTLPTGVLTGASISGQTITLSSGGGNVTLTTQDTNTVYSLPSSIPTGVSFANGTLSVVTGAGTATTTIPDTNTNTVSSAGSGNTAAMNNISSPKDGDSFHNTTEGAMYVYFE
jgi:hypothetical protein